MKGLACQYDKITPGMDIYLLRHGIAEDHAASDADRDLTDEGRQKVREVMTVARRAGVQQALILSSPYRRALATARIAAEVLGSKAQIVRTQALTPDSDVQTAWEEVRIHREERSLLLVGHEPLFSTLAAFLLGVSELSVDFKKGALVAIGMPGFSAVPHGILKWMLTARLAPER